MKPLLLLVLPLLLSGCAGMVTADCRAVGLDEGWGECHAPDVPPPPPPYCTRTLAEVQCWKNPGALPDHPPQVADGPRRLTAAQQADRRRHGPRAAHTGPDDPPPAGAGR